MTPRKKILFVITKSNWGGAQRYVFDLATSLAQDQYDVAVAFGQSGRLAEELRKAGIKTHQMQSLQRDVSFGADIKSFFELMRLFKTQQPDIVHLNSSKVGGLGALAARAAGVPKIIFTAHGWPFWEKRSAPARTAIWIASWLTALLSHKIIVISTYDLKVARQMPFVSGKVVRIYNGIHPIDFLPREPGESDVRVLTNGELIDNKNLFVGIDAVLLARERGAKIKYSIMSDGELREQLKQYIKEKQAEGCVEMLGFVAQGARHYKNFDIFFLPSKKEGLPYVLLEAGMAGLPVIASNVGGIPEIIASGENGLLAPPSDTGAFARALGDLAENRALRQEFGENLHHTVEDKFSIADMLAQTTALYLA